VHLSLAATALTAAIPAASQESGSEKSTSTLGAVIVTAQKREESIQDVPIAVTALTAEQLTARGLDGGPQILQAVPNVTFSKQNFTSYNLQIRGVGSKLIAASGDQGVGIHHNNVPLAASRFFEAEFFDMERIEVLRGPQGTLYGRNATGGVFNAITAKPTDKYEGMVSLDYGNYDSLKIKATANLPLGEYMQLRLAGISLSRDGYLNNTAHNTDVDGRDLYSTRATLAFNTGGAFKGYLLWEHFKEDDDRQRTGAQLCTKDPGPASVGGQSTTTVVGGQQARSFLSQGCLPGSLYSPAALGTINSNGALGGVFSNLLGLYPGDVYANQFISSDLRTTGSYYLPTYKADADIAELNLEFALTDDLLITSLSSYNEDSVDSRQDYNRSVPNGKFLTTPFTPGGNLTDPQIGTTNTIAVFDKSFIKSTTWTEELRLQSSFDGKLNFNVGAIYIDQDSPDQGYYVFFNTGTAYAGCYNLGFCTTPPGPPPAVPIYIDPNREPNGEGHNYYYNKQTFSLQSVAGFGEVYFQMTDALKLTVGARYTQDEKKAATYDFNQQFIYPGRGWSPSSINHQEDTFDAWTGRAGVDWKINDDSMLYAFYSRGYKGGGFNSATAGKVATNFDPETVDAFEVGMKNTFADGRLQANATVFAYDYKGYQISRIVNLSSVNDNIDAKLYGAELELVWSPLQGMRIDANVGYLHTEIQKSDATMSIDVMNRTQGDPSLTVIKGFSGTNCVAPTSQLAQILGAINAGLAPALAVPTICGGGIAGITPTEGKATQVAGNELPNSPEFTFSVGIQQTFNINGSWATTLRGDYYQQTDSYARIYNTEFDRIKGWSNVNLSWSVDNSDLGLTIMAYAKNLLDEDNITDVYLTDDSSGLFANSFLSDPQLIGLSVTKRF
jgi:outer membrane receptor protein involved in Fe transport